MSNVPRGPAGPAAARGRLVRPALALRVVVAALAAFPPACPAAAASSARRIVDASGIRGGLLVHVGCADGKLTARLRVSDAFVVHGLDTDERNVAAARRHLSGLGLYGKVAVDAFDGEHLPYVDNLVNLLVADGLGKLPMSEVMRVLAPRGVAILGKRKVVKPWPEEIDEWTHFLHGPDNNAVADDRAIGPPRRMQWLAGPRWTRHHHADKGTYPSVRAVVSARGRLYYMVDETRSSSRSVPSTWFLAGRDGFSGVLLWKRRLAVTTFQHRLEQLWRTIIACGDRVVAAIDADGSLSALDGSTGAVLRRYDGTAGCREAVLRQGTLFVVAGQGGILALEADSGKRLWRWDPGRAGPIVPLTLAASGGKVFARTDRTAWCLSAAEGKVQWQFTLDRPGSKRLRLRWPRERLIVKDGVVLCSHGGKDPKVLDRDKWQYLGSHPRVHDYGGKLVALSAADGSVLWRSDYLPGLESMPGEIYVSGGVVWLGPAFAEPRDLHTGRITKRRPVLERLWTDGHHHRCYPGKATCRYILTAKRGIEMIDLAGENHSRNNWVRATCRVGVTPCNGLLYAPPHSCGCYMEARLYGFWALAPAGTRDAEAREPTDAERLERGPAYGRARKASPHDGGGHGRAGWRTYRGDPARSASTRSSVPPGLKPVWRAEIAGPLTPATIADGKVLVAQVDAHTVHALDAAGGNALWSFTAGGRVDSPPTLHAGLVLFGSRDGWIYCLRSSDGALLWRFLAARGRRRAVAREQVESLWPVHGSVLVKDGVAYAAAGRSSHLDGGITLWGLDAETGKVRCTRPVVSRHAGLLDPPSEAEQAKMSRKFWQNKTDYKTFLAPDRSDAFSMRGALPDVLVADAESIFLRHLRFDASLVPQDAKRQHLFATSSLLDGREHHRSFRLLGTGDFTRLPIAYPWLVNRRNTAVAVPCGLMLAFDEKTVWGVRGGPGTSRNEGYVLFATPRPDPSSPESLLGDFQRRSARRPLAGTSWSVPLSIRPRAMLRAGENLIVGGMESGTERAGKAARPGAAAKPPKRGLLLVVSAASGKTLGTVRVESPPVWDGLAAVEGRLVLSLETGAVVCLGTTSHEGTGP